MAPGATLPRVTWPPGPLTLLNTNVFDVGVCQEPGNWLTLAASVGATPAATLCSNNTGPPVPTKVTLLPGVSGVGLPESCPNIEFGLMVCSAEMALPTEVCVLP